PGAPPAKGDVPPGTVVSGDVLRANRIPPGQSRTRKWPVLDAGQPPPIDAGRWELALTGLVLHPATLTFAEFARAPRTRVLADFHCVTRWSRLGNFWEGIATREIIRHVAVSPRAQFVLVHAELGWTTNMPLQDFLAEDALFADRHDGEPLSHEHGGPVRLVVPHLYAWKSAKWVRAVEFLEHDRPGYWEQGGYHLRGDPWREQRHREDV
ncbi:MAG: sulfite oxidase-like oxidoreductase, partial [Planctomycetota bacterium]